MKSVSLTNNHDGTWTARIYFSSFTGTYERCVEWLNAHGEYA